MLFEHKGYVLREVASPATLHIILIPSRNYQSHDLAKKGQAVSWSLFNKTNMYISFVHFLSYNEMFFNSYVSEFSNYKLFFFRNGIGFYQQERT